MTQITIKAGQKLRIIDGYDEFHGFAIGQIVEADADSRSGDLSITAKGEISWRGATPSNASQILRTEHYELVHTVDFNEPLQTRDGRPVTLVTAEGRGKYPVMAYIEDDNSLSYFTAEGAYYDDRADDRDLQNVPVAPAQVVRYVNLYTTQIGNTLHETREKADAASRRNPYLTRTGVRKVVLTEGEFDA